MKPQPFVLLDRRAGWRNLSMDSVHLADGGCSIQLAPLPGAVTPVNDAPGTIGGFTNPIRVAVDSHNRIYVLDASDCTIKRLEPCEGRFAALPCIGGQGVEPRKFQDPQGLAISPRDDLYVADTGNSRVQIFSVKGLALRAILEAPDPKKNWQPRDVAVARDCRVYVADYLNGLIHVFDAAGCWRKSFDGADANNPALVKPVRVAIDREGRIYVVQEAATSVVVLQPDGKFLATIQSPDDLYGRFCPASIAVDAAGNLHITDRFQPLVRQFECGSWRRKSCAAPGPVRLGDLTFDGDGKIVGIAGKQLVQMDPAAAFATDGEFVTAGLDSRMYRCPWHRVAMHCYIPAGTQITVETLTAEADKTAAEIASLPDTRWTFCATNSTVGDSEWDCLVQSPPGRYLWLRLQFHGDGHASPCIDALRIYYPRASSLQYLPAVYSQDEPSREFLDRFLSIFDTLWGRIGGKIGRIASYFDPMATPTKVKSPGDPDFLSWLAGWLGLTLDRHWPEHRRRLLVKNAWKLFQLRGTPRGLKLHLQLYTGVEPQILEHFKLRRWLFLNGARLGDCSALWGADIVNRLELDVHSQVGQVQLIDTGDPLHDPFYKDAYQFTVFLPVTGNAGADPAQAALQMQTIQRIIEMSKPAHTLGYVKMTRPAFRIGVQSYVGMDTVVGVYPERTLEGKSKLGQDSVLSRSPGDQGPPDVRVGKSTRLGSGTRIN